MGLSRHSREFESGASKLWKNHRQRPKNKREEHHFMEKKEELGRRCFELKSVRGNQEFWVRWFLIG